MSNSDVMKIADCSSGRMFKGIKIRIIPRILIRHKGDARVLQIITTRYMQQTQNFHMLSILPPDMA